MTFKYKDRIAFWFMLATALVIAIVFIVIFATVSTTVYSNLDGDLSYEAQKHSTEIIIEGSQIRFINKAEWEEREHREVQVNPVFIQLIDSNGALMDKSPNLKESYLRYMQDKKSDAHFNTKLNHTNIRQVQVPLTQKGVRKGYIIAAMSLEASLAVINNLRNILLLAYPLILIGLFFLSRIFAGRSIAPVKNIIRTTDNITRQNMSQRVALPAVKDELFDLSFAINELLDRIEKALQREQQFTSDASHELRTPLASLKGTLEVLIRKDRSPQEYVEKIKYSLSQINNMTLTLEKLLTLARFHKYPDKVNDKTSSLITIIDDIICEHKQDIQDQGIRIKTTNDLEQMHSVPHYYSALILNNIIANSIKYSPDGGEITIAIYNDEKGRLTCSIADQGLGIKADDMDRIFTPFYRSEALDHKTIAGDGLGLSIAQKAAEAMGATLKASSVHQSGTTITLTF